MISVKLLKINHNTVDSYNILKEILISEIVYDSFKDFLNPDKKQCINIIHQTNNSLPTDVIWIHDDILNIILTRISIIKKKREVLIKLTSANNHSKVELLSNMYDLNSLDGIIREYFSHNSNFQFGIFIDMVY